MGRLIEVPAEGVELVLGAGPDPSMDVVVVPVDARTDDPLAAAVMNAVLAFSGDEVPVAAGDAVISTSMRHVLDLSGGAARFRLADGPGRVAVFTEHHPDEFGGRFEAAGAVVAPSVEKYYKPDHEHDEEVTSVGITDDGALDVKKFNAWLSDLLQAQGQDIFRMKGVLNLHGRHERFVFQGVHMLFDGRPDRPWGTETRGNRLIFIGRKLDRDALTAGFQQCLV